ncbi:putative DNA helicase [Roseobacter sp. AzwK-3b]|uniref:3'-5' exonuclease n=1 Tax=Roseobacter sp. AzwK-3b TaxID=351016 RepID=UPI0001568C45|nr:3'-5' exonuclease [Roseobacter sp. AzwK-3b]EDM71449.1 putative DNA helicase [Roseobacter sp. AzwK-3b]
MTFRIAESFSDALARLTPQEQKAVKTAAFDLQMSPDNPGLSLHRVDRARDKGFWTARVNRDIRLVLHKTGGDTLLAWVGHHDDAYAWAERRRLESHPRTGAMQIVEIRETVEEVVIQRYVEEAVRKPRLFEGEADDALLSWGVPEDWLDVVRDATEDTVLDIAGHLPAEAGEALLQAATGGRPQPAAQVEGADPFAHPDAGRRFRVMENVEELRAALDSPWERWAVYLHPAQREYVDRDFNGPARVIGSAGTGKTVVALHRAVRLAQDQGARVLLTTFNAGLAEALARKLPLLAGEEVRSRITVTALGPLIADLHAARFGETVIASERDIRTLLHEGAAANDAVFNTDFVYDEWSLVVDAWDVRDLDTYRDLPRLGRKVRMPAARRDAAWAIFEGVRTVLSTRGMKTEAQLAHDLTEADVLPFTHAVIDEAQDISVPELRLLGRILGKTHNGLFFAGDIGQRIFRAPFPWAATGVEIRGRSRSLKVNYRTSHQIRRYTDDLLPETLVEPDGTEDNRLGVTSLFNGTAPEVHSFDTRSDEVAAVNAWLKNLAQAGVSSDDVICLVRTSSLVAEVEPLVPVRVSLMHEAKGAEYRAVAVLAIDQDMVPLEERLLSANDEARLDEVVNTERHLLYVAASRARDQLWMSGVAPISEFLQDLL